MSHTAVKLYGEFIPPFMVNGQILRLGHTHKLWCNKKLLITCGLQRLKSSLRDFEVSMSKPVGRVHSYNVGKRDKMADFLLVLDYGS